MKLNPLIMMRKECDNTGIVFDPNNNSAMALNTVGVVIWESIEKGLSEEQIVASITAKYKVDAETAAKDVAAFLETLKAKGLLAE